MSAQMKPTDGHGQGSLVSRRGTMRRRSMMPKGGNTAGAMLNEHAPSSLREEAVRAANRLNASHTWIPLARLLTDIRSTKAWRNWGFRGFTQFVEEELDLGRSSAADLLKAYGYLVRHHGEYLGPNRAAGEHLADLPSYSSIAILARALDPYSPERMVPIDRDLFRGKLTRRTLKAAIRDAWALRATLEDMPSEEAPWHRAEDAGTWLYRNLREGVEKFFEANDLAALRGQMSVIFEGWDWENACAEDLAELLDQLQRCFDGLEILQGILQVSTVMEKVLEVK